MMKLPFTISLLWVLQFGTSCQFDAKTSADKDTTAPIIDTGANVKADVKFHCYGNDSLWKFDYFADNRAVFYIDADTHLFTLQEQVNNEGFDDSKVKIFNFKNQKQSVLLFLVWAEYLAQYKATLVFEEGQKKPTFLSGSSIAYDSLSIPHDLVYDNLTPAPEELAILKSNYEKNLNLAYTNGDSLVVECWGREPHWEVDILNASGAFTIPGQNINDLKAVRMNTYYPGNSRCLDIYQLSDESMTAFVLLIDNMNSECGCGYLENPDCGCGFDMSEYRSPFKAIFVTKDDKGFNSFLGCGYPVKRN